MNAHVAAAPRPGKHYARFGPHNARMAFRRWRRSRPFWAGLWCVLGGGMMMLGPLTAVRFVLVAGQTVWLGIVVGALVSIFGLFFWFSPSQRQITGVFAVMLSVVSFITSDFGGFLIGMTLGVLGASMGFAWVPAAPRERRRRVFRRQASTPLAEPVLAVTGTAVEPLTQQELPGIEVSAGEAERTPAQQTEPGELQEAHKGGRFRLFRR